MKAQILTNFANEEYAASDNKECLWLYVGAALTLTSVLKSWLGLCPKLSMYLLGNAFNKLFKVYFENR